MKKLMTPAEKKLAAAERAYRKALAAECAEPELPKPSSPMYDAMVNAAYARREKTNEALRKLKAARAAAEAEAAAEATRRANRGAPWA